MFVKTVSLALGAFVGFLVILGWALLFTPVRVQAEQENIKQMDVHRIFNAVALSSSGTILSTPFRSIERSTHQTVLIQASGASPNYSVELLVTLDRDVYKSSMSVAFTKPEVGGDLYTFTDALPHIFPLYSPACLGQQLRVIGQGGGAVQGNITASALSQ